jgi:hypothetical protein
LQTSKALVPPPTEGASVEAAYAGALAATATTGMLHAAPRTTVRRLMTCDM